MVFCTTLLTACYVVIRCITYHMNMFSIAIHSITYHTFDIASPYSIHFNYLPHAMSLPSNTIRPNVSCVFSDFPSVFYSIQKKTTNNYYYAYWIIQNGCKNYIRNMSFFKVGVWFIKNTWRMYDPSVPTGYFRADNRLLGSITSTCVSPTQHDMAYPLINHPEQLYWLWLLYLLAREFGFM